MCPSRSDFGGIVGVNCIPLPPDFIGNFTPQNTTQRRDIGLECATDCLIAFPGSDIPSIGESIVRPTFTNPVNGVSGECFTVLDGKTVVGVFTSQLRAMNAAIRYAEKHGDYVETPITKDDFQDFSHNAKGEAVEWKLIKKDLCLDVSVEKHKNNFLQG